ncbi:tetratricopeptide repeat protein [Xanthocytophaga agilis]|uniref:histidine kinase n=1 Tax=Xanthocytophaga agilis TaxID=3048010 RepID=A0AAE3R5Y6_9BACT|nr:tetratricopeptide repeat protein [Xanthocytophaga agilis]MDJ1502029.1 tetratricopeptide repeat protein [Xanthocytophaga agilis]
MISKNQTPYTLHKARGPQHLCVCSSVPLGHTTWLGKACLLTIAALFAVVVLQAQDTEADSLLQQLKLAKDTSRINVLNQLSFHYNAADPAKAIAYATQALQLSQQLDFKKGMAQAFNRLGIGYSHQNKYAQAMAYYDKALPLSQELGDLPGELALMLNIGMVYHKQDNRPKATEYYLKGLKIAEKLEDDIRIANIYNFLGNIYSELEDYPQAIVYYQKSLELKKKRFTRGRPVSQVLNNLGDLHMRQKEYQKALPYFTKALDGLTEQDKDIQAACFINMGLVYGGLPDGGLQQYSKALEYLNQGLRLQQEVKDPYTIPYVLTGLAYVYQKTDELTKSEANAQQALQMARQMEIKSLVAELYQLLSQLASRQKKYQQAYDYQSRFIQTQDSLRNDENTRQIAKLQADYETEKKQAEIELLKKESEKEALLRNIIGLGLLATLIIGGLIVSRQRLKIRNNRLLVEKSLEISQKNEELAHTNELLSSQSEQLSIINETLSQQSRQLAEQTTKLKELDQVKSTFFANISHEFRTPLTLILGNLQDKLEAGKGAGHPETLSFGSGEVTSMHRNAGRLLELINQLLDLSKLESGKMHLQPQAGNLSQFFRLLTASFSSLAESREIAFKLDLPAKELYYAFDSDKLHKIFANLLSNAFKFTPNNGEVSLRAEVLPSVTDALPRLKITVQDSGSGISVEQLNSVFERFYQGSQHYSDQQGTGIGLALVKELVQLHGGQVYVASDALQGTRFVIELPLAPCSTTDIEPIPSIATTTTSYEQIADNASVESTDDIDTVAGNEQPLILIVEDNDDLRAYIRKHLEGPYRILESSNGKEGFDTALAQIPDLVITDLMMPEMSGTELCERLKTDERTNHISVIMLTALATQESKLQGLQTGADDYLTKPFDARELRLRVGNLLESRRKLRERFSKQIRIAPSDIAVSSVDEKLLERILKVVEENMSNTEFGSEEFAREAGLSRMQLHRKLTALTGQSTSEFLRSMRLKRAAQLLDARAGNVSDVAYQVGFDNLPYFSKCFREQFDCTPSEYLARQVASVV